MADTSKEALAHRMTSGLAQGKQREEAEFWPQNMIMMF